MWREQESERTRQSKVIDYVDNTSAPPTEVKGDRYILDDTGGGVHADWDGAAALDLVEYTGAVWTVIIVGSDASNEGTIVYVDNEDQDRMLVNDGSASWEARPTYTAHDVGGVYHNADTLANFNSKLSDATLLDTGDIEYKTGALHAASEHEDTGAKEINVGGLSGLLADNQNAIAHDLGGSKHNADTLVNLNAKLSDATLIKSTDLPVVNHIIRVSPGTEIAGIRYNSYANALTYALSQTPSSTNRYGIEMGGEISEAIAVNPWVAVIAKPGARFTGAITSTGALTDLLERVFIGGEITNLALTGTNGIAFYGTTINGGTPAGGLFFALAGSTVRSGDFSLVGTVGVQFSLIEGGKFPAASYIYNANCATIYTGSYTFAGGTFRNSILTGSPTFDAGTYGMKGCHLPNWNMASGTTAIIEGGSAGVITINTGNTLTSRKVPGLSVVPAGGTWNNNDEVGVNGFRIQDNADPGKGIDFDASLISALAFRTIQMPDKDITLDDDGDSRPPDNHASDHQNTGGDEINVAGLSGLLADDQNPVNHASDHENTGGDEMNVAGLSGALADPQVPSSHNFASGGFHSADTLSNLNNNAISDLITTYGGLRDIGVGTLAQRPAAGTAGRFWWATDNDILYYDNGAGWDTINAEAEAHDLGGSEHNADTLANLNGRVSDATLLDTGDIQFKTGALHAAGDHQSGGSLAVKLDDLAAPDDNTDLDATISAHGLLKKLPNDASKYLDGQGNFTTPPGGTKNLFIPISEDNANYGNYRTRSVAGTGTMRTVFMVPDNFSSLNSIKLVLINLAGLGSGLDIDIYSDYGGVTEQYDQHSESDTTSTYDFGSTTDQTVTLDVSAVFSSIAANDFCGLYIDHKSIGGTVHYIGLLINYDLT